MSDAPVQSQAGIESQPPLPVRRLAQLHLLPSPVLFPVGRKYFSGECGYGGRFHVHRNVDKPSKLDDPKELDLPEGAKASQPAIGKRNARTHRRSGYC